MRRLRDTCNLLLQYLPGLEKVEIAMCSAYLVRWFGKLLPGFVYNDMNVEFTVLAAPLKQLLTSPQLKLLNIKAGTVTHMKSLAKAVIEGKEELKDLVRVRREDGSGFPS